jgi:hypothetical protein
MLVGRGRQEAYPPITALLKPVYKIARVSFLDPLYLPAPLAQLAEQVTLNHGPTRGKTYRVTEYATDRPHTADSVPMTTRTS